MAMFSVRWDSQLLVSALRLEVWLSLSELLFSFCAPGGGLLFGLRIELLVSFAPDFGL